MLEEPNSNELLLSKKNNVRVITGVINILEDFSSNLALLKNKHIMILRARELAQQNKRFAACPYDLNSVLGTCKVEGKN